MEMNEHAELAQHLPKEIFGDARRDVLDKDRANVSFNMRGWHSFALEKKTFY